MLPYYYANHIIFLFNGQIYHPKAKMKLLVVASVKHGTA